MNAFDQGKHVHEFKSDLPATVADPSRAKANNSMLTAMLGGGLPVPGKIVPAEEGPAS